ncbi:MAG TPA: TIGR03016 family PEP-CTERM system-associated outer membrane protein [Nitrospirota bacterium]|nr:TIGR03016 family PEP-CTERM system-associated outer membrane protein [Nitrospirota bacterium]
MKATGRILAVLLSLCMAAVIDDEAAGSEVSIRPAVSVSEEYNDNVLLSPHDRVDDYITRIIPSVQFFYKAPLWDWDISYAYDYRLYAYRTIVNDSTQRLKLANHTSIVKEFLLLDVRNDYDRKSLTPVRDYAQESISVNQTDTNTFTATPYVLLRPSSDMSVKAGYQYRSVWYEDPNAINKVVQSGYADTAWEMSQRTSFSSAAGYTRTEANKTAYCWTDLSIGAKYEYAEDSTMSFTIGKTWFTSERWERASQVFWNIEIIRKFLAYTLSFNTALTYVDDPTSILRREDRYVVSLQKETERMKFGATAGVWEYRKIVSNYLQDVRYGATGAIGYSFTPALKLTYNLAIERFEDKVREASTGQKEYMSRYLNGIRLDHPLSETVTVSADYRYTNNYAPHAYNRNYYNNRVLLELTKRF